MFGIELAPKNFFGGEFMIGSKKDFFNCEFIFTF